MSSGPADILFAISDTGGGHRSAAVAISAALDELSGGQIGWRIEDFLRQTNIPGVREAPDLYDTLSTRWLKLYDLTFQITNERHVVDMLTQVVLTVARRNLARLLRECQPKVVVVTHPLVTRMVCDLRRSAGFNFRIITVVTDLVSLHASWTYPGVDLLVLPTDEAFTLALRRGMKHHKMVRTGFPVHPKFIRKEEEPAAMRAQLGLHERFTILLTSGGVGSGRLGQLVQSIERHYPACQLLVVTGKNRTLQRELSAGPRLPTTTIFGFVDNMEQLMAAADLVVSKAGPGTLMEALVIGRPVLVTEAVGMQEQGNIDLVLNHELGYFCPTDERIVAAIGELQDPAAHAAMRARVRGQILRDGSFQIARIAQSQLALAETVPAPLSRRRQLSAQLRRPLRRLARPFRRNQP